MIGNLVDAVVGHIADISAGFLQHIRVLPMDAADVMDIGAIHEFALPGRPIRSLHPDIVAVGLRSVDTHSLIRKHQVIAAGLVHPGQCDISALDLVKSLAVADGALNPLLHQRSREGSAVPQQLSVVIFRMPYRHIRHKGTALSPGRRLQKP